MLSEAKEHQEGGNPWKLGGAWTRCCLIVSEGASSATVLTLDLWLPRLWENSFLLLSATRFAGICYGYHRTLIQLFTKILHSESKEEGIQQPEPKDSSTSVLHTPVHMRKPRVHQASFSTLHLPDMV